MKLILVENGARTELDFEHAVVSVGRSVDNDIRLADEKVSRHHCRIELGAEGPWVHDLGSSNGTQVNGERITRCLLNPGDRLGVGNAALEWVAEVPVPAQNGADADAEPTRSGALGEESLPGVRTMTGEAQRERENLRVCMQVTRQLVRETELPPLLRLIVDSAVSLAGAERGFLLLRESPAGTGGTVEGLEDLRVRVARSFDKEDIVVPASRLSRGIAKRVLAERAAILTVDAGRDQRFSGLASVEDLRLRSVLCVPIAGEEELEGLLYVDNRLQSGAFSEDHLELMTLLSDQASIAIRNARLVAELRERNHKLAHSAQQIDLLNQQLGRRVRDRDTELAIVRAELERERGRYDYGSIVGASEGLRSVFQRLDRIIESELPVLIQGESGTGKELIARAIHYNGPRKEKPFVTENCAALPDSLLESELFGHTRGAFTGAHRSKKGLLEQADGGTLFLDEIGDMSPEMQKKLLRVLQEGEFRLLGSNRNVTVNVRVIAASHRDLEGLVRDGNFREDLYYRINVLSVPLPSLRERREDIPLLAEHLLARAAREAGRPVPILPREVVAALVAYDWPGNVRELENEMRRIVVLADDEVRLDLLTPAVLERRTLIAGGGSSSAPVVVGNIREAVADLERRAIEAALAEAGGNKSRAAKSLGISRFALQRKLDKYGMGTRGEEGERRRRQRHQRRGRARRWGRNLAAGAANTTPNAKSVSGIGGGAYSRLDSPEP